ncbi:MAG: CAP domain-containing protein, partial [Ignavibacteria bacterium]
MNIVKIAVFVFATVQMFSQDSSNQEFLQRINELRLKKNVEPLLYDEELYVLGKKWGNFILKELKAYSDSSILAIAKVDKNYFHIKAIERFDAVLKKNYISSIGENLHFYMDTKPVSDMVERSFSGWKHSTSHYLQMVNKELTHVAYYGCYDP